MRPHARCACVLCGSSFSPCSGYAATAPGSSQKGHHGVCSCIGEEHGVHIGNAWGGAWAAWVDFAPTCELIGCMGVGRGRVSGWMLCCKMGKSI
jgi:hypothetical protein